MAPDLHLDLLLGLLLVVHLLHDPPVFLQALLAHLLLAFLLLALLLALFPALLGVDLSLLGQLELGIEVGQLLQDGGLDGALLLQQQALPRLLSRQTQALVMVLG